MVACCDNYSLHPVCQQVTYKAELLGGVWNNASSEEC